MLEGVRVLSKEPITKLSGLGILLMFVWVLLVASGLLLLNYEEKIGLLVAIIGLIIYVFYGITQENFQKETGRYEYQVIIDESVSFKKMYDKYNIIEIKGNVYTIQDKGK